MSLIPGDEVWILPGLKVIIILHQLVNGNYIVVGEAYILGIKCREAIKFESNIRQIILEHHILNICIVRVVS